MAKQNGAQTVYPVSGRQIVYSAGNGKTNMDELVWLSDTVLEEADAWKSTGWAYIADCTNMEPVTPHEGTQLANMTKAFVDNGCKAFAFVEGDSVLLKIQAKKNTERSKTGILEGHFVTLDEALAWLKEELNL